MNGFLIAPEFSSVEDGKVRIDGYIYVMELDLPSSVSIPAKLKENKAPLATGERDLVPSRVE